MKTKTKFVLHWVNPEGSQGSCAHFTGGETEALRAVTQQVHSRKESRSQVCCPQVWCAHHQPLLGGIWTEWHRGSGWKAGKMPVWQCQSSNVVQWGFRNLPIGPLTAPSPAPTRLTHPAITTRPHITHLVLCEPTAPAGSWWPNPCFAVSEGVSYSVKNHVLHLVPYILHHHVKFSINSSE